MRRPTHRRLSLYSLLAACALVRPAPAHADQVTFSNLGPGDTWVSGAGWQVAGQTSGLSALNVGMGFTATHSGALSKVELAISPVARANSELAIVITEGLFGPGFTETFYVPSVPSEMLVVGLSSLHPMLTAGSTYWIRLYALNDTVALWLNSPDATPGPTTQSNDPDIWPESTGQQGAFRVSVASVPEGSSWLLLTGAAPLGVYGLWRRRRA